ncbi:cystathionine gamma-synthase [Auriculariales sp. MPI-PUGE-AT-0066]|nr:cystathionine gamma-synthase [Auriculariales sp. MPI-PUGE-AT-0066]
MASKVGTQLIHADDNHDQPYVAPPISVSTTFKLPQNLPFSAVDEAEGKYHIYSRYTQDVIFRVEKVLGALHGEGCHAITFSSGLSSVFVALLHLAPRRIAITKGYFGVHETIKLVQKASRGTVEVIGLDDEYQPGDICWLETPVNPTGEARDIEYYAQKVHKVGGKLVVDSTFGPPLVQNPFEFGADIVMHSGTKYFGGHSDLLSGVLVVKTLKEWKELWHIRTYVGNVMGSLDAWLLLRSMRSFHVRIPRQSATAASLVQWLAELAQVPKGKSFDGCSGGVVHSVLHASLQQEAFVKRQLPERFPATFAILLADEKLAGVFPHLLKVFTAATSLGGVESLIEQRGKADGVTDMRLLRLSVGLEELEDLKQDLRQAINSVSQRAGKL